ncbi:hypothetical protein GCM10028777_14830 [Angustibacter speluncae]
MAVLIDPPRWPAHGRLWSHLVSDTDLDELHAFADRVGLPRRAFEGDHYDVPAERYDQAVAAGAEPVEGRVLLSRLVASGLRVPKRRGERVLSSRVEADGTRVDVVRSGLTPPPGAGVLLDLVGPAVLLVRVDGAWGLPPQAWADGPARPLGVVRRRPPGSRSSAWTHLRVLAASVRVPAGATTRRVAVDAPVGPDGAPLDPWVADAALLAGAV